MYKSRVLPKMSIFSTFGFSGYEVSDLFIRLFIFFLFFLFLFLFLFVCVLALIRLLLENIFSRFCIFWDVPYRPVLIFDVSPLFQDFTLCC